MGERAPLQREQAPLTHWAESTIDAASDSTIVHCSETRVQNAASCSLYYDLQPATLKRAQCQKSRYCTWVYSLNFEVDGVPIPLRNGYTNGGVHFSQKATALFSMSQVVGPPHEVGARRSSRGRFPSRGTCYSVVRYPRGRPPSRGTCPNAA